MSPDGALVSADNSGGYGRRPRPVKRAAAEVNLDEHMKNGGGRIVPLAGEGRSLSKIDGVRTGDIRVNSSNRDRDAVTLEVIKRKKEEVCEFVLFCFVLFWWIRVPDATPFLYKPLYRAGLRGKRCLMNMTEEEQCAYCSRPWLLHFERFMLYDDASRRRESLFSFSNP